MVMVPDAGKMHFRHSDQQNSSWGGPRPPHGLRNFGAGRVGLHTTWSVPPKPKILATPLTTTQIQSVQVIQFTSGQARDHATDRVMIVHEFREKTYVYDSQLHCPRDAFQTDSQLFGTMRRITASEQRNDETTIFFIFHYLLTPLLMHPFRIPKSHCTLAALHVFVCK